MRIFSIIALFLLSFILQSTVFQYIAIFDVIPNTNLILIILVALFKNKKVGGTAGLIIGLLQDILFGNAIGVHGLIYFSIGYFIGVINPTVSKDNAISSFILTFLFTIISNIMFFFIYYFSSVNITFVEMIREIAIIEAIYNGVLSILLYKVMKKLFISPNLRFSRRG
ncbi:rod shape-determining protein MreD [Clostridium sp. D2Q-11]|uniref:Rod shape-determining protein MreD n=1 Tax=Anaeromonas frigoriresistens TaxID=2683708 RepID=A0A942UUN8_9FIRM|nr:rod shape-determining protein MreD [Anaeromonas frigoriresistens]MBS4537176.1 rod shape-determining protein MreD [Anaeromonas frigoriresistens]